ncbi:MAG: UDP-N-acetylmuramate--L-alanine ligase [Candidatus Woesebacteria bacterium]|jgi:UDP-N-acetylmuramate--alanine ligase
MDKDFNLLNYQNFYLVGVKGVAMTSLAQCLIDAKKNVRGSDLAESFVTQKILDKLAIKIDLNFNQQIPKNTDCLIYTSAHQAQANPQVIQAQKKGIKVLSQAEALASLFNQKQGIAVCGVGGKSTVSAMITWILEKNKLNPSFSVGVGDIIGLGKTGQWSNDSKFFVAEADEYVIDPKAKEKNKEITPRFSFLKPFITICTNLKFDHPDVYQDFNHTKKVFSQFFRQIKKGGTLLVNTDNEDLIQLSKKQKDKNILSFGEHRKADFRLTNYHSKEGETIGFFEFKKQNYQIKLKIPGKFNLLNAIAATATCYALGIDINLSLKTLQNFSSTLRRFEFKGKKNGVKYYDDYAHHPSEVYQAIKALNDWYPNKRKLITFQSHTFSRTKKLFSEFVDAFREADEVLMIDIFASAREAYDPNISSDQLCQAIIKKYPRIKTKNLKTIDKLANYFKNELQKEDICLTLGAGDIYKVHEMIK